MEAKTPSAGAWSQSGLWVFVRYTLALWDLSRPGRLVQRPVCFGSRSESNKAIRIMYLPQKRKERP